MQGFSNSRFLDFLAKPGQLTSDDGNSAFSIGLVFLTKRFLHMFFLQIGLYNQRTFKSIEKGNRYGK